MDRKKLILIQQLCESYEVEVSFFQQIEDSGLLDFHLVSEEKYIHRKQLKQFEKILRLHRDLNVNMEGIDVILNLMKRIEELQKELRKVHSHLGLYE